MYVVDKRRNKTNYSFNEFTLVHSGKLVKVSMDCFFLMCLGVSLFLISTISIKGFIFIVFPLIHLLYKYSTRIIQSREKSQTGFSTN